MKILIRTKPSEPNGTEPGVVATGCWYSTSTLSSVCVAGLTSVECRIRSLRNNSFVLPNWPSPTCTLVADRPGLPESGPAVWLRLDRSPAELSATREAKLEIIEKDHLRLSTIREEQVLHQLFLPDDKHPVGRDCRPGKPEPHRRKANPHPRLLMFRQQNSRISSL